MRGFLWGVQARTVSGNILVGSVAAAATAGALIAVGRRMGSAILPFAAIGAVPFHRTPSAVDSWLVATGFALHVVVTFAWSALFILMERALRRDIIAACVIAVGFLVVSWVVAITTGTGLASVLPFGDRVVVAVVLAGALVVGMRFARPVSRIA